MAHSHPNGLANRGEAWRITQAGGAFIVELAGDGRVRALYEQWCRAREVGRQVLTVALERARAADEPALWAWVRRYDEQELEGTQSFVADQLGLSYRWVAPALLEHFRLTVHNTLRPTHAKDFGIPVFMVRDAPRAGNPKSRGSTRSNDTCSGSIGCT